MWIRKAYAPFFILPPPTPIHTHILWAHEPQTGTLSSRPMQFPVSSPGLAGRAGRRFTTHLPLHCEILWRAQPTKPYPVAWQWSPFYSQERLNICVFKRSPWLFYRKRIGEGWVGGRELLGPWHSSPGGRWWGSREGAVGWWEADRFPGVQETESTGLEAAARIQKMMIWIILFSEGLFVPGTKLFI